MTLEEIRAMAACNPQYFDHCHSCMLNTGEGSGRGKCSAEDDRGPLGQPALAALLVRAVEALRPFAYPKPYDEYAIVGHDGHGHPLNAEGVQRLSAHTLLRELGVEA